MTTLQTHLEPTEHDEEQYEGDVPSDAMLAQLRTDLDEAEAAVERARSEIVAAMNLALAGGVTMTHIAGAVGWSRQWCYSAISRWG